MSDATPADERQLELYRLIDRYLNQGVSAKLAASEAGVTERQFYRLVRSCEADGLDGLARKSRRDKGGRRIISTELQKIIEGACLQKPKPTLAWVHRKIKDYCARENLKVPSYSVVWRIYGKIPGEQKVYAHKGPKAYKHEYGIIHRWSAEYPNQIWQCDHKELKLYGVDLKGRVGKVWLTAIEDDYSRAIVGYYLGIEPPSSLRVALARRQAIWCKPEEKAWPMCGIPEKFYTDHGSDFKSSHIEQVAADLKFELIDSSVGEAEPRGKVERLFLTADQMFVPDIKSPKDSPLPVEDIDKAFRKWPLETYLLRNEDLNESPMDRWKAAARIPRMPDNQEALDLMLLHVGNARKFDATESGL